MQRHLVLSTKEEFEKIISGEIKYLIRFFKKRQEFLNQVKSGDLVFLKIKKEILGQFIVGKVVFVEKFEKKDLGWIKKIEGVDNILENRNTGEELGNNSVVLIVQIQKVEQLITSPIDMPIVRKEWVIL